MQRDDDFPDRRDALICDAPIRGAHTVPDSLLS